jgi:hypothetical protein
MSNEIGYFGQKYIRPTHTLQQRSKDVAYEYIPFDNLEILHI